MALTLETTLRDDLANQIDDSINAGTTNPNGELQFQIAAGTEVATIEFDATAFGAASTGVITMSSQPKTDTSATGNASPVTKFSVYNRDQTKLFEGTVATSGADINITNTTIGTGDAVELTTFTITVPAS